MFARIVEIKKHRERASIAVKQSQKKCFQQGDGNKYRRSVFALNVIRKRSAVRNTKRKVMLVKSAPSFRLFFIKR